MNLSINWTFPVGNTTLPILNANINDTLIFLFSGQQHNVYKFPNENAYTLCNFSNATLEGIESPVFIQLIEPGSSYFGCSIPTHCQSGLKIKANVVVPNTNNVSLIDPPPPTITTTIIDSSISTIQQQPIGTSSSQSFSCHIEDNSFSCNMNGISYQISSGLKLKPNNVAILTIIFTFALILF